MPNYGIFHCVGTQSTGWYFLITLSTNERFFRKESFLFWCAYLRFSGLSDISDNWRFAKHIYSRVACGIFEPSGRVKANKSALIKKNTVRITRPVGNSHTTVQYRRTKMSLDGCRSSSLNVRSRKMRRIPLIVGGYILFPSPTISTGLENSIADTAGRSSELQKIRSLMQ